MLKSLKTKKSIINLLVVSISILIQFLSISLYTFLSGGNIEKANPNLLAIGLLGAVLFVLYLIVYWTYIAVTKKIQEKDVIRFNIVITVIGFIINIAGFIFSVISLIGYMTF